MSKQISTKTTIRNLTAEIKKTFVKKDAFTPVQAAAKKAGIWTKKVTDVKYPAMKWLTSERGRAEKLRAEAERKRLTEQAAALKAVLYPEP